MAANRNKNVPKEQRNDVLDELTALLAMQNKLMENSNPTKFNYPFNGKNHETLTWIFAAEKYLRVNDFQTPKIQFQRIFDSMHPNYQNRYLMDTTNDPANLTFDKLKSWVLKEYPPPKTKYEFKLKLKSMMMYKNEDPNIAYSRYKYKLAQIEKAIKTINEGLKAESNELYSEDAAKAKSHYDSTKLRQISSEDKREALTRMFVIRNNKAEHNNNGVINQLVHKYILKKDPRSIPDWNKVFQGMKRELIPRILDGQKEYEYISYPVDKDNDSIYTKRHHQPNTIDQPTRSKTPKYKVNGN